MITPVFKGRSRDSHRNFFYSATFLEPRLSIFLEERENLSIQQVFQVIPPVMSNQIELTFGRYLEDLDNIAQKYGCNVDPWAPALREAKITPEMAYAMSVNFAQSALPNIKNMAGFQQLLPVAKDLHDLLQTYADFAPRPADSKLGFSVNFLRAAMMSFRREHNDLAGFDEKKAQAFGARLEPKLSSQFQVALGEIHQKLFLQATLMKGAEEGQRQAQRYKEKNLDTAPAGP
jgi:hypothetical protein